jgi:hypothetical protein
MQSFSFYLCLLDTHIESFPENGNESNLPESADVMAAKMTDKMTDGPVMWHAA